MMNSNVLVGCPTAHYKGYCLEEYAKAVKSLTYQNYEVLLVDNSKEDDYSEKIKEQGLKVIKGPWFDGARERIVQSRNMLREKVLKGGYDYFFSLEQDVIPEKEVIEKLITHGKNIVSGVVHNNLPVGNEIRLMPMVYVAHPADPTGLWYISDEEVSKPQLIEVKACSLSCVLIHRRVLEKIRFRYAQGFDDMMFSKDSIDSGFKIFVDTKIKPTHLHSSWKGVQK